MFNPYTHKSIFETSMNVSKSEKVLLTPLVNGKHRSS